MRVCATLGVPFMTLDCEAEYKKEVVDYMIREYAAGRVPNPDIFCNKYVKFGVFLEKALAMGADYIATGHYARVMNSGTQGPALGSGISKAGPLKFELHESSDKNKDQSYFLYTLNQHQLFHTLFPVGHLTKPEVRELAVRFNLTTAEKKDSQGLCFIGKVNMKDFLKHFIETVPGDVLNTDGEVIGHHDGALLYAIGERHGFIITKKSPSDPRFFVMEKNMERNTLTVAGSNEFRITNNEYNAKEIVVRDLHWIADWDSKGPALEIPGPKAGPWGAFVRIRYRQEKQTCTVEKKSDGWHIVFETPQSGVSVGQSAVLYDGETCLGGGIIDWTQ